MNASVTSGCSAKLSVTCIMQPVHSPLLLQIIHPTSSPLHRPLRGLIWPGVRFVLKPFSPTLCAFEAGMEKTVGMFVIEVR